MWLFAAVKEEPMETDEVDSPTAEVTNGAATIGIPHRDLSVQPPASAAEFFRKAEEKGELKVAVVRMYIHIRSGPLLSLFTRKCSN